MSSVYEINSVFQSISEIDDTKWADGRTDKLEEQVILMHTCKCIKAHRCTKTQALIRSVVPI